MAGLDLVSIQDSIVAYIKQEFAGYEVFEDYILDDEQITKMDNKVKPYIVISWDGLGHSASGRSFSGARHDEYFSGFEVGVIASAPKFCRKAMNIIMDKLIGMSIQNSSSLIPSSGGGVNVIAERAGKPNIYVASAHFVFQVNATDVASHITP